LGESKIGVMYRLRKQSLGVCPKKVLWKRRERREARIVSRGSEGEDEGGKGIEDSKSMCNGKVQELGYSPNFKYGLQDRV